MVIINVLNFYFTLHFQCIIKILVSDFNKNTQHKLFYILKCIH